MKSVKALQFNRRSMVNIPGMDRGGGGGLLLLACHYYMYIYRIRKMAIEEAYCK